MHIPACYITNDKCALHNFDKMLSWRQIIWHWWQLLLKSGAYCINHQVILYNLCFVGIGISFFSILIQFLSNRSQYVSVDGCRSKVVNVVSWVPQGSVLGPLLSPPPGKLQSFFPFWRICWSVMPMAPLCCLLCHPQALELQCRVHEPGPRHGEWVELPLGDEIECE